MMISVDFEDEDFVAVNNSEYDDVDDCDDDDDRVGGDVKGVFNNNDDGDDNEDEDATSFAFTIRDTI